MTKGKKYDVRIAKDRKYWSAEIIRQVTSTKTMVSKSRKGFATEAEAQVWADEELKVFMQKQGERNMRRSEKRK